MLPTGKKIPIPGLELTPDVILSTDAGNRQAARRTAGLDLASALLDGELEWMQTEDGPAILNTDTGELVEDRSAAFAALLAFAADESNHVSGLLDDGHGGTFHGGGALWKSSLRLDPNWMETMRRRSRGVAKAAMRRLLCNLSRDEILARAKGWWQRLTLKLITLTIPHVSGSTTLDETKRINTAFTLLRKREIWTGAVAGAVKGIEDALDADGPHVHIHLLALSRWIDRAQLVEEWRQCVDSANWTHYGYGLAEDCPIIVDIREVKENPRKALRPGEVEVDQALNEVTKYITKPADFLKRDSRGRRVPREVLLELCEVRRWPRMFEILGRCRESERSTGHRKANAALAALVSIRRAYLTGDPIKIPASVGWEMVESWDSQEDGPLGMRKSIVEALKERDRAGPERIRPPSWRDLLDQIPLSEWLSIMADRFRRGKNYRIRQLLDANPSAYLVSFSGKVYENGMNPC